MTEIWIVNMGLGRNDDAENRKAMHVFPTKRKAFNWVKKHFEEQLEDLEDSFNNNMGLTIGNSFHIYRMNVEE